MTQGEQLQRFDNDLDSLINRYSEEFDLIEASVIGLMIIKTFEIIHQSVLARNLELDENEDDDEEEGMYESI